MAQSAELPSELDWLLPGSVEAYKELGNPSNSGQVNPYMMTKTLADLAEDHDVKITATAVKLLKTFKASCQSNTQNATTKSLPATDILLSACLWTPKLFTRVRWKAPRGHSAVINFRENYLRLFCSLQLQRRPMGVWNTCFHQKSNPDRVMVFKSSIVFMLAAMTIMTCPYPKPVIPWLLVIKVAITYEQPSRASPKRSMTVKYIRSKHATNRG